MVPVTAGRPTRTALQSRTRRDSTRAETSRAETSRSQTAQVEKNMPEQHARYVHAWTALESIHTPRSRTTVAGWITQLLILMDVSARSRRRFVVEPNQRSSLVVLSPFNCNRFLAQQSLTSAMQCSRLIKGASIGLPLQWPCMSSTKIVR